MFLKQKAPSTLLKVYFCLVMGLACVSEYEMYTGGSPAGGRATRAGQISSELPERELLWSSMLGIGADNPMPVKGSHGEY
jgi:hypothetical protein